jgi:hypothetical protein
MSFLSSLWCYFGKFERDLGLATVTVNKQVVTFGWRIGESYAVGGYERFFRVIGALVRRIDVATGTILRACLGTASCPSCWSRWMLLLQGLSSHGTICGGIRETDHSYRRLSGVQI